MVKYKCKECGKIWYTANTGSGQTCDDCGGLLEDTEDFMLQENINSCSKTK